MIGVFLIFTSLSFSILIFNGNLSSYLLIGAASSLIGSIVLLLFISKFSSSAITIAGPQDTVALMSSLIVASIANHPDMLKQPDSLLPTIFASLIILGLTVAVIMGVIGWFKLGELVRFIPYTIIAGFIAGTGLLLMSGAIRGSLNIPSSQYISYQLLSTHLFTWAIPFSVAFCMFLFMRYFNHYLIFPLSCLASFIAFVIYIKYQGISFHQAQLLGWTLNLTSSGSIMNIPSTVVFYHGVNWKVVFYYLPEYMIVPFLSVIGLLLNITGIEKVVKSELKIDHELRITSVANGISALLGGLVGYQWFSYSLINYKLGTISRTVGMIAGFVCVLFFFADASLTMYIPNFILSSLLLYVSFELIYEWLFKIFYKVSKFDYLIIWLISIIIVINGYMLGVSFGMLFALSLFFYRYSKISSIKYMSNANMITSKVEHNKTERLFLDKAGQKTLVVLLNGYLFFGNSNLMSKKIIQKLDAPDQKYTNVIIDFSQVSGLEITGIDSLYKVLTYTMRHNILIILTHLNNKMISELSNFYKEENSQGKLIVFNSIEEALDDIEKNIISNAYIQHKRGVPQILEDIFGDIKTGTEILSHGVKEKIKKNDFLFHQGDLSESLYLLTKGSLNVIINYGKPTQLIVKKLQNGNFIGEMGFYTNIGRSASIIAEEDCVVYKFSKDILSQLETECPHLSNELHKAVIRMLSDRLSYHNRVLNFYSSILIGSNGDEEKTC